MSMEAGIGVMGTKLGMMTYFEPNGLVVPVTVVGFREGNIVTQVKTEATDGYNAVQLGYRRVRDRKLTKPEMGHLKKSGVIPLRHLQEFRLLEVGGFEPNQRLAVEEVFKEGDLVDVSGTTIGKGFQGLLLGLFLNFYAYLEAGGAFSGIFMSYMVKLPLISDELTVKFAMVTAQFIVSGSILIAFTVEVSDWVYFYTEFQGPILFVAIFLCFKFSLLWGGIKRHHFRRGPMSHGSHSHREPGSIGAGTTPGRVFPGKKMPGRMGGTKRKIRKLRIVKIDPELRIVMIKGAVPGKPGNLLRIAPAKIVGKNIPKN
ncbi:hypothetical protein RHMOL_Rhmol07G0057000 [Rhododendron molle]|uniref:Uncharacterized protein n=1 Tax=Rhododendron molle TaxID=49168 RepID=A0ACC0MYK9_RHOML|nr:hypothetical protein RHMOL_Rhmol07G0057000 [Rhododendron molle]